MQIHGSKAQLYRPTLLALTLMCLALLPGVVQAQNRVFLWGNNANYQLGTIPPNWPGSTGGFGGTSTYYGRTAPGLIRAFTNDLTNDTTTGSDNSSHHILTIACGYSHTLALKKDGTVWCWGDNSYGQLGNGSFAANSDRPVQVVGLPKVIAIAAGGNHSMALDGNGNVWTWGDNTYGEAGIGRTGGSSPIPQPVAGFPTDQTTGLPLPVTAIAAGNDHCMALLSDSTAWAWGHNGSGQLGDGKTSQFGGTEDVNVPSQVTFKLANVISIAAGANSSQATTKDGGFWVWGAINTNLPVTVPKLNGLTDVKSLSLNCYVSTGGFFGGGIVAPLIVKNDKTLWYLTSSGSLQATQVTGITNAIAVSGNASFTLVIHDDGTVWSRGDNAYGELGNGTTTASQTTWVQATGLSHAAQVQVGSYHAMALDASGKLWSWGNNGAGELTLPSPENQSRPTRPHLAFGSVRAAAVGSDGSYAHFLFLHKDGTVWSYGSNSHGQLGNGGTTDSPYALVQVARFSGAVQVAANKNASSYAITSDSKLYSWGKNSNGQLGNGTTNDSPSFQRVGSLTGVIAVAPGSSHALALTSDGLVYAWGYNSSGQLGDGTTTDHYSPAQVPGLSNVIAIAAGDSFSLALTQDGHVWAWGDDRYGQLGDGSSGFSNYSKSPAPVSGLPQVTAIAAGTVHSMALASDGTVYCWGRNGEGELGNGTTSDSSVPIQVPNLTGVKTISAGSDGYGQSFAIRKDNTIWAWGNDYVGQLGDGVLTPAGVPMFSNSIIAQPNPSLVDLPGVRSIASCNGVTLALVKDVEPYLDTDDQPDLLCQNTLTAHQQAWYMNGTGLLNKADFGPAISANWTLGGMGDLNADGFTDLLWQKSANSPLNPGEVNGWLMNGAPTPTAYVHVFAQTPAGWNLVGLADMDNDGFPDMIWQKPATQVVRAYYTKNGVWDKERSPSSDLLLTLPAGWVVAGTADMDGDGWPDLIAQNPTTGAVRVWYLKGKAWTGATDELAPGQSGWHLASIQDMDGDSNPDLIWQTNWGTSMGSVICWQMDNIVGYTGTQYTISTWNAGESIARAH